MIYSAGVGRVCPSTHVDLSIPEATPGGRADRELELRQQVIDPTRQSHGDLGDDLGDFDSIKSVTFVR